MIRYKLKPADIENPTYLIDSVYDVFNDGVFIGQVIRRCYHRKTTWIAKRGERKMDTNTRKKATEILLTQM